MYPCMKDITFTGIACRAAMYPVVMRRGQLPRLKGACVISPPTGVSEGLGWLLFNTRETNRILVHAPSRKTGKDPG
jgi:hypothetical protein